MSEARAEHDVPVRRILQGDPGLAIGVSFVPDEALAGRAGEHPERPPLVSLCGELDLDFAFVSAHAAGARPVAESLIASGTAVMWAVDGPFGRVAEERGWARTLADSTTRPDDMDAALDRAAEGVVREITSAPRGSVGCVIAEDLAADVGPIFEPRDVFERHLPRLARLAAITTERGMAPVLHSDGDIRVFLPAIVRAGFASVHVAGVDELVFRDVYEAARSLGLGVIGGVSGRALRAGGPDAVSAGVRAGELASASGLLLSDDGGITTAEEIEALASAIEAARGVAAGVSGT